MGGGRVAATGGIGVAEQDRIALRPRSVRPGVGKKVSPPS